MIDRRAIAIAFSAVVVAVIIYGRCTGAGDAGFIATDGGHDVHHDRMPLTCWHTRDVPPGVVDAFDSESARLSTKLGFGVATKCMPWMLDGMPVIPSRGTVRLQPHDLDGMPAGSVSPHGFDGASVHGRTILRYDEGGTLGGITVSVDPSVGAMQMRQVIRHEIGHVMGLDHDTHPGSIMLPGQHHPSDDFTGGDIKRLRSAYGN